MRIPVFLPSGCDECSRAVKALRAARSARCAALRGLDSRGAQTTKEGKNNVQSVSHRPIYLSLRVVQGRVCPLPHRRQPAHAHAQHAQAVLLGAVLVGVVAGPSGLAPGGSRRCQRGPIMDTKSVLMSEKIGVHKNLW